MQKWDKKTYEQWRTFLAQLAALFMFLAGTFGATAELVLDHEALPWLAAGWACLAAFCLAAIPALTAIEHFRLGREEPLRIGRRSGAAALLALALLGFLFGAFALPAGSDRSATAASYAKRLEAILSLLDRTNRAGLKQLGSAEGRSAQRRAALRLARDFDNAAARLRRAQVDPEMKVARRQLLKRLTAVGNGYRDIAAASGPRGGQERLRTARRSISQEIAAMWRVAGG